MKYFALIITLLLSILSGCKKDDCKETLLPLKNFENEFGCINTKYTLLIDLTNNCTIIRSKADYDLKVTGNCHPTIDFSIFDLIIGRQSSGNENDTIKYDLRRICPSQELTLTVDIFQTDATRPDNVTYHALIPKLGDEETINVKITVQ
jgi:hypothetical protein